MEIYGTILEKMGFGGSFIQFFQAITWIACWEILINGKVTEVLSIPRSVWQPRLLDFATVFHCCYTRSSLSFNRELSSGKTEGIRFRDAGLHLAHQ